MDLLTLTTGMMIVVAAWALWRWFTGPDDHLRKLERMAHAFADRLAQKYPTNEHIQRFRDDVRETGFRRSFLSAGYSINKGETIALCTRNGITNDVVFVLIHELAHVYTHEWGHTDRYWSNFAFLLREAEEQGLWKRVDYSESPADVCGDPIEFLPKKSTAYLYT